MKHLKSYETKDIKYLKSYEAKLRFKNFKDMKNWTTKEDDSYKYTGKKKLDKKLGEKVIDFFEENSLHISVKEGYWLEKHNLKFPSEKNLKEYRVCINKKESYENWLNNNNYDDTSENRERWEEIETEIDLNNLEWSVFLPTGIKNYDLESSAMDDSSNYLKLLMESYPDMLINIIDKRFGALEENPDGFKKIINAKNIVITNKNVEIVSKINTRLYKDSKVFYFFKKYIFNNDSKNKEFFNDWLKLINEKKINEKK